MFIQNCSNYHGLIVPRFTGSTVRISAFFGQGSGPVLLDGVSCTGQESQLTVCPHFGIGMVDFCFGGHTQDVGVICGEGIEINV